MNTDELKVRVALNQGDFTLDVDVCLPVQGVTVIFGPSGSGKTTLLRCIAGLESRGHGEVIYKQQIWQSPKQFLPTCQRGLGYVFQEASLFTHLDVQGNLNFGKKRIKNRPSIASFTEIIAMCGIEHLLARQVPDLSGGEKQRVAIARALLTNPQLLLMDEPLASLDEARKQEILPFLERVASSLQIPIVYVTHSLKELVRMASHVVLLDQGTVKKCGTVVQVFGDADLLLNRDLEPSVVVEAVVSAVDERWHLARVDFDGGNFWVKDEQYRIQQSLRIRIFARDISLSLTKQENSSIVNIASAQVVAIENGDAGAALVRLVAGNTPFLASVTQRSVYMLNIQPGNRVWMQVKSVAIEH